MIKNLEKKWLINKSKSFMIGDSLIDKKAAQKSKLNFKYAEKDLYKQVKSIIK